MNAGRMNADAAEQNLRRHNEDKQSEAPTGCFSFTVEHMNSLPYCQLVRRTTGGGRGDLPHAGYRFRWWWAYSDLVPCLTSHFAPAGIAGYLSVEEANRESNAGADCFLLPVAVAISLIS
eukprot:1483229-Rhodomonas_salina.1